jgi:hypothetical protein
MRLIVGIVSLVFLLASDAAAQDNLSTQRELLGDRPDFEVIVEEFDDQGRSVGLTEARMRTAVETRLFELGLPLREGALSYIYVRVVALPSGDWHVYHATVDFKRTIPGAMVPYHSHFFAVWHADTIGTAATSEAKDQVIDSVLDLVDQFANDYLAVND